MKYAGNELSVQARLATAESCEACRNQKIIDRA